MSRARSRKTWVYILVGAVPAIALISLTVYVLTHAISDMGVPGGGKRLTQICASRLRLVAQASLLYAEQNDQRLPLSASWVDATWSLAKVKRPKDPEDDSESVFRCPTISTLREGGYGYAFNRELGGESLPIAEALGRVPLVFDSKNVERNANGRIQDLLPAPEARHDSGRANVIAFASGNVQVQAPGLGSPVGSEESGKDKAAGGLNPLR